ncbi:hypothetical protein LINGRAHAP2_LOCUS14465 [Linum grandiflorum]
MEDSGSGVEEEYWVSHEYGSGPVVEKGLTLGKRLLITGFVVTSAPVVVPPFLVISALGFACSIPYVLFLATYSFTEILMPKLLPLPPQDHQFVDHNNGYEGDDDQVYMNKGREELFIRRDEGHEMEAIKEEKEEQVLDEGLQVCAVSVVVTEEGDGLGSAVEPIEARSTVVVEVFEDGEENEEFAEETTGLLRRIRDEGLAEDDDEQPLKEKEIPAQEPTNHRMSVDDKTTDASIEHLENGNAGNTEDAAFLQTAEVDGDATDNKNGANVHASTKVQKKVVEEEEETIREQINTLRAIVGYSGTGQMTCMEELKALYVFTGVVPPQVTTSLSDADDLAEVYGKLQNLKLIVGVE